MRLLILRTCTALFLCSLFPASTVPQSPPTLESRRKALNDLLAEQWEYLLRTYPTVASILGDKRWNDKLDDFSQEAIDRNLEETQKFLTRFEAIDTSGFPEQEALNKPLMVRDLQMQLEGARFKGWEMPVDQQNGIQVRLPQLVNLLSFQSVKDYEDYISRLTQMPRLLDQNTDQMRKGMNDKLMPPRFLLEKALDQCNAIATQRKSLPSPNRFLVSPRASPNLISSACGRLALPRLRNPSYPPTSGSPHSCVMNTFRKAV
jgi:uncharacterized protein (DUF885 family)